LHLAFEPVENQKNAGAQAFSAKMKFPQIFLKKGLIL